MGMVMAYDPEPKVSIDFNHTPQSSIFAPDQTKVAGRSVRVLAWYDNEWGFSCRMADVAAWLSRWRSTGSGRIGRNVLRAIIESGRTDIEVVAINDLGPVETNAHLLRYDSVHGRFPATVTVNRATIDVGRGPIKVTAIRNPADLPWGDVDVIWNAPASSPPRKRPAASVERRQARADLGPRRGCRQDHRLRRERQDADQGRYRRLERQLHHQLPVAGGQGAE
jgi:glyceraldehyde-3-phosphate dehydrogenase/erythrose-4-phosphate dehydrogenase